jgi:hypothetical protein
MRCAALKGKPRRKTFCCAPLYRSDLKNEECESGSFWTALKFNHPKIGSQPSRVAKSQAKKRIADLTKMRSRCAAWKAEKVAGIRWDRDGGMK